MKSFRTKTFKKLYLKLPDFAKVKARKNYKSWMQNPYDSEVKFENIYKDYWSVSVGYSYRALGKMIEPNTVLWFWIGTHETYNQIIKHLKNIAKGSLN